MRAHPPERSRLTAQSPRPIFYLFRKPEIGEFDMPICGDEDIFGFEIAVDDGLSVEEVEGDGYFCGVEFGYRVREFLGTHKG